MLLYSHNYVTFTMTKATLYSDSYITTMQSAIVWRLKTEHKQ